MRKLGTAIGVCVVLLWGGWRWFIVAGGPWPAGHSCAGLVSCRDGLCLVHARQGGALTKVPGYCSRRCQTDAECPSGMACEALPAGISRAAGDHLPYLKLPERLCVRR